MTYNGTGVNGATVTFTPITGTAQTTTTSTVNGVAGSFTSPGLIAGTYTVTATATVGTQNLVGSTASPIVLMTGQPVTGVTIVLAASQPDTLTGTVTAQATNALLQGATVTATPLGGGTALTATTSATGTYTLTLQQGLTYSVTVSLYSYNSQTVSVSVPVSATAATLTQNFQLTSGTSLTSFASGKFNLVSWPYFDSFTAAFGPLLNTDGTSSRSQAFYYLNGGYIKELQDMAPDDEARPGYGYFIYFYGSRSVYTGGVTGMLPAGSTVDVPLNQGWNMIGTPSTSAISVSRLGLAVNGNLTTPFSFDQAASGPNVYVSPVLYSYDPNSNRYVAVVSATGAYGLNTNYNGQTHLQPFQGYWLYSYQSGDTLVIPTSGG